jgi:hypothetical protein
MNVNITKLFSFFSLIKNSIMNIKTGPYIHIPPILDKYDYFVKKNFNNS